MARPATKPRAVAPRFSPKRPVVVRRRIIETVVDPAAIRVRAVRSFPRRVDEFLAAKRGDGAIPGRWKDFSKLRAVDKVRGAGEAVRHHGQRGRTELRRARRYGLCQNRVLLIRPRV